jgi:hypothetical protein
VVGPSVVGLHVVGAEPGVDPQQQLQASASGR